jgi:hypothetical protein
MGNCVGDQNTTAFEQDMTGAAARPAKGKAKQASRNVAFGSRSKRSVVQKVAEEDFLTDLADGEVRIDF